MFERKSRNPFYIRSMIHTIKFDCRNKYFGQRVAIPSTSGQWFPTKFCSKGTGGQVMVKTSQSPSTSGQWFTLSKQGHVPTGVLCCCRNPFYIRSMILHNFLDVVNMEREKKWVAIPSTSGQWFSLSLSHGNGQVASNNVASSSTSGQWFPRLTQHYKGVLINRRNPFYIRSMIPTDYWGKKQWLGEYKGAIPSTSGQWFTRYKEDLIYETG